MSCTEFNKDRLYGIGNLDCRGLRGARVAMVHSLLYPDRPVVFRVFIMMKMEIYLLIL